METGVLIAVLLPLIIVEVVLLVAALYDLTRPNRRVRSSFTRTGLINPLVFPVRR